MRLRIQVERKVPGSTESGTFPEGNWGPPVGNVITHESSHCSLIPSSRNYFAEPMFEVHDLGNWTCFNCHSEFPKSEPVGRHLYTCLDLRLLPKPVPSTFQDAVVGGESSSGITSSSTTCDICFKVFKNPNYLPIHTRIHTGEKPYKCGRCSAAFAQRPGLDYHKSHSRTRCAPYRRLCTDGKLTTVNPNKTQGSPTKSSNGKKSTSHSCVSCSKVFKCMYRLERHSRIHSGNGTSKKLFKCSICSKEFKERWRLIRHWAIHKSLNCPICTKFFTDRWYLKRHLRVHTGVRPFKCKICGSRFAQQYYLKRHESIHEDQRPFVCAICETGFNTRDTLKAHVPGHSRGIPLNSRAVKCTRCSQIFNSKSHLIDHAKLHGARKKRKNFEVPAVKCTSCFKVFNSKSNLARHISSVHRGLVMARKPKNNRDGQVLPNYSVVINTSINLKYHSAKSLERAKTNGTHKCTTCSKTFGSNTNLLRHKRIHQEGKPFTCSTCTSSFRDFKGLKRHQLVHSDQYDYKCEHCIAKFKRKYTLRRHMQTCH